MSLYVRRLNIVTVTLTGENYRTYREKIEIVTVDNEKTGSVYSLIVSSNIIRPEF